MGGRFIQAAWRHEPELGNPSPEWIAERIKSLLRDAPFPRQARGPGGAGTGQPAGGPFPRQHPAWLRFLSQTPFLSLLF